MDPWHVGAQQHQERQQHEAREAAERQHQENARRKAEQEAADAAREEMKQAVAEAVPLLARFLQERGAAAQALLGSTGPNGSYIVFGDEREGGSYFSVSLDKTGLVHETGRKSGYDHIPSTHRTATPEEAVEAFAYYGPGYKNPQRVRTVVEWLTERINGYLPR